MKITKTMATFLRPHSTLTKYPKPETHTFKLGQLLNPSVNDTHTNYAMCVLND